MLDCVADLSLAEYCVSSDITQGSMTFRVTLIRHAQSTDSTQTIETQDRPELNLIVNKALQSYRKA